MSTERMRPVLSERRAGWRVPRVVRGRPRRLEIVSVSDHLIIVGDNAFQQELASPHVCADGSLALAYGSCLGVPRQTICDRIYSVTPAGDVREALAYAPVEPVCKNYLGAGAGLARRNGIYHAILPVEDSPDAEITSPNRRQWLAWAISDDGLDWNFIARDGGRTKDPLLSFPFIMRADRVEFTLDNCPRIWHPAMCYNEIEDCFDVCFGYAGAAGISATWWKVDLMDDRKPGDAWRRDDDRLVCDKFIPEDDSWAPRASWPRDAVDPMEIVRVNGQRLFFYLPARENTFTLPTPIAYARMGEEPQLLDTSPVWEKHGVGPGNPAGNYLSVWPSGKDRFRGYIAASPKIPPPIGGQGLVEIELAEV